MAKITIMAKQIIKQEIFYFLGTTLGVFILMELMWPRIILAYFNINWLLMLWLMSGFLLLKNSKDYV